MRVAYPSSAPFKAWVVTFAGTAVNLCLGILYAWSVWKANLIADADHPPGSPMGGRNEGWTYLTDAQATAHQNEERAVRAYQKMKGDDKLRERMRKALQIALALLEEGAVDSGSGSEAEKKKSA